MTCWFEPPPRRGLPTLSQWTSQHYFVLRMILSDLPTPAEALVRTTKIMPGLRAGGKPVPIPDQVRDRLFRDHALCGLGLLRRHRLTGNSRAAHVARLALFEPDP